MNKAFAKKKVIRLDEKWDISPDADHGVVLTFKEKRFREESLKEFLYSDKYYFPRVSQALSKYCEMSLNNSESIDKIVENSERIFNLINTINNDFKQFG